MPTPATRARDFRVEARPAPLTPQEAQERFARVTAILIRVARRVDDANAALQSSCPVSTMSATTQDKESGQ